MISLPGVLPMGLAVSCVLNIWVMLLCLPPMPGGKRKSLYRALLCHSQPIYKHFSPKNFLTMYSIVECRGSDIPNSTHPSIRKRLLQSKNPNLMGFLARSASFVYLYTHIIASIDNTDED
jgi:hypothetical protein